MFIVHARLSSSALTVSPNFVFFCIRLWALKVSNFRLSMGPLHTLCAKLVSAYNIVHPQLAWDKFASRSAIFDLWPQININIFSLYFKLPTSSWQTVSSPALFVVSKLANLFQPQIDVDLFSPHIFIKIHNYQTNTAICFVRKQLEIENSFKSKSLNHSISVRLSVVTFVSLFSCCSKISERSTTEKVCSRTWISSWCPFCVRTYYKIVDN